MTSAGPEAGSETGAEMGGDVEGGEGDEKLQPCLCLHYGIAES